MSTPSFDDDGYEYRAATDAQLADMLRYAATVLARSPAEDLAAVREDLLQAAELLIPAAELMEEAEPGPPAAASFRAA